MKQPFILVTETKHRSQQWVDSTIKTVSESGYSAYFGARVPFIPSSRQGDLALQSLGGQGTLDDAYAGQLQFLHDLARQMQTADEVVALDLRFVTGPMRVGSTEASIDIQFIGKAFDTSRAKAYASADRLWSIVTSLFRTESPTAYPLEPVDAAGLDAMLAILPGVALTPKNMIEIRQFEDCTFQGTAPGYGWFPHRFEPALNRRALRGFIETLSKHRSPCVVSICLQPTRLFSGEQIALNLAEKRFENGIKNAKTIISTIRTQREKRLANMQDAFKPLIEMRNQLLLLKVQIVSQDTALDGIVSGLGSEMSAHTGSTPRLYATVAPQSERDLQIAIHNLEMLEYEPYNVSSKNSPLSRISSLITANEALGAFRLPIAPDNDSLGGLAVRLEPFPQPANYQKPSDRAIPIGEIMHRGMPTGEFYYSTLNDLTRHVFIAGITGSGKSNTCLNLVSNLWALERIPSLVINPLSTHDYRALMVDQRTQNDLLVFTINGNGSPFCFNPFHIADGISVQTHISRLLTSILAASDAWDPIPSIYQSAALKVYRDKGWNVTSGEGGDAHTTLPTMSDFYDAVVSCSINMTSGYGSQAKGSTRQGPEIRIRGLLEKVGHVINTAARAPIAEILDRPTIMEISGIGSLDDKSLVMGFLMMLVSEEFESRRIREGTARHSGLRHMTIIEEAHIQMPGGHGITPTRADATEKAAHDMASRFAEDRNFGAGNVATEQVPKLLITGVLENTQLKIMHRLDDQESFTTLCAQLGLNGQQAEYARSLPTGDVIVNGPRSKPVHLRVPHYAIGITDTSDRALRNFMLGKIAVPMPLAWDAPENPFQEPKQTELGSTSMQSRHRTELAHQQSTIHQHDMTCRAYPERCDLTAKLTFITNEQSRADIGAILSAAKGQDWGRVVSICNSRIKGHNLDNEPLAAFCYLAVFYRRAQRAANKVATGDRPAHFQAILGQALDNFFPAST